MKKLAIIATLAIATVALASTLLTRNVNVGLTPTLISASEWRTSFLVQNQGPNDEWCQLGGDGGTVAVGVGIKVNAAGGSWGMPEKERQPIWCVTQTAAQVDGANTVIVESR